MRKSVFIIALMCLCISTGTAQNTKETATKDPEEKEKLSFLLKDGQKPDVYIDGKKYDADIIDLLDQSLISTVDVIKGEKAMEEYDAPNGVVIIKTMKYVDKTDFNVDLNGGDDKVKIEQSNDPGLAPLIVIDGEISDQEKLSKFSPNDIESIEILKGQAAMKRYKAKHGVVIVKTKKGG